MPINVLVIDQRAGTRQELSRQVTELLGDVRVNVASSIGSATRQLALAPTHIIIVANPLDIADVQEQKHALAEVAANAAVVSIAATGDDPGALREQLSVALREFIGTPPSPAYGARDELSQQANLKRGSRARTFTPTIIVIAVSTGGPDALAHLLRPMTQSVRVPILVVQHMTAQFTSILADRLDSLCELPVSEATDGQRLEPGHIYVAPGGRHLTVRRRTAVAEAHVHDGPPVNFSRPSADALFTSAAETFGAGVLGLVMTGMGADGTVGAKAIAGAGGYLIAQDPATATVASMPAGIVEYADEVIPLEELGDRLVEIASRQ